MVVVGVCEGRDVCGVGGCSRGNGGSGDGGVALVVEGVELNGDAGDVECLRVWSSGRAARAVR